MAEVTVESLLKRVNLLLEDGEFAKADEYAERILGIDHECAEAYLIRLCCEFKVTTAAALGNLKESFSYNKNYVNILRYGDESLKKEISVYADKAYRNSEEERKKAEEAKKSAEANKLAAELFAATEAKRLAALKVEEEKSKSDEKKRKNEWNKFEVLKKKYPYISNMISGVDCHIVGLKSDGTVKAVYNPYRGQCSYTASACNVSSWRDIVAVAASGAHTVGLKSDGTVIAVGDNKDGQCDVSAWRDIVAISAGDANTVGLKSDGTVVAVGNNKKGQCKVYGWRDIVAVAAGDKHTVGLKSDGTVVAVGLNDRGQCNVKNWRDIIAVSAGSNNTVGLKANGTVVAVGSNYNGQCDVSEWRDIVAVSTGGYRTLGLKSDGTVVGTMDYSLNWSNIIAVSCGNSYAGLRLNGTVAGGSYGAENWKLFDSVDELEKMSNRAVKQRISALLKEQTDLQNELASLKGLFKGKRKKEITARLEKIEKQLSKLQKTNDTINNTSTVKKV